MISKQHLRQAMTNAGIGTYSLDAIMNARKTVADNKRKAALYKALRDMGYSYNRIGIVLGRDHSTICQIVKKHYP